MSWNDIVFRWTASCGCTWVNDILARIVLLSSFVPLYSTLYTRTITLCRKLKFRFIYYAQKRAWHTGLLCLGCFDPRISTTRRSNTPQICASWLPDLKLMSGVAGKTTSLTLTLLVLLVHSFLSVSSRHSLRSVFGTTYKQRYRHTFFSNRLKVEKKVFFSRLPLADGSCIVRILMYVFMFIENNHQIGSRHFGTSFICHLYRWQFPLPLFQSIDRWFFSPTLDMDI